MLLLSIPSIIVLIPIIGAIFIACCNKKNIFGIRAISFWVSLFSLLSSLLLVATSDRSSNTAYENIQFSNGFNYAISTDSLSLLFVPVISLICFLCILWITKRTSQRKKTYYISILLFEAFSIGAFYAMNIFLIYALVEITIIPLYIIMSLKKDSRESILHFLFYTMISALLVLMALILIYQETNSANLLEIYKLGVKSRAAFWLLIAGISIKLPIWPFYSWLPIVHVKTQTVCSVILAAVVLKFSSLLILRFIMPLFSDLIQQNHLIVFIVVMISLGFALSQMIFQDDLKSIFAYFSILHLNSALLMLSTKGNSIYYIFSIMDHSVLVPVLFFAADAVKRTYETRSIKTLQAITIQTPEIKAMLSISFFALSAFPFSWGFISEITKIKLISELSSLYSLLIAGVILISSFFIVYTYNNLTRKTSNVVEASFETCMADIYKRIAFYLPVGLIILIGMFPRIILEYFK